MWKFLKFIFITALFLSAIALVLWIGKIEPGTILAGIAAIIAAIKARLFGDHDLEEDLKKIEQHHQVQRDTWNEKEMEFEQANTEIMNRLKNMEVEKDSLVRQMDSLSRSRIKSLYSEEEIAERLRKL